MSEAAEKAPKKAEKAQKKSWFKGLQAEFKKVIWPDRKTLAKQTTAVVAVSVVLGAGIAGIDAILRYGVDLFVKELAAAGRWFYVRGKMVCSSYLFRV